MDSGSAPFEQLGADTVQRYSGLKWPQLKKVTQYSGPIVYSPVTPLFRDILFRKLIRSLPQKWNH